MSLWSTFLFSFAAAGSDLPFLIDVGPDLSSRFPGAPRLQSFAWAQWDGKWVFIAGRTAGYHGVGGSESDFPRKGANSKIWVVDPTGEGPARIYSFPVTKLPASLGNVKDQWMSSNPLFFQDGPTLYIAGGYGQNSQGAWVTYPVLSAVNLPALIEGVEAGRDSFASTIAHTESPLVQVTGGELLKLDDGLFYVAGGHDFEGSYGEFEAGDEKNTAHASQTYTSEIRKLRVGREGNRLSISLVESFKNPEFARRDLNASFRILSDGHTLGAAIYGGVFTQDQLAFTKPVYWGASGTPKVEKFDQKMSAYTCAKVLLFDPEVGTMYTTFLGGISGWTWDYASKTMEPAPRSGHKGEFGYFDGLSWIDHISTLVQEPSGTHEIVQPTTRLPAYLGTNAAFIPAAGLSKIREDADVYDLRPLRGKRTLVGYLYGGIRAVPREFPHRDESRLYRSGNVPTSVSDMILPIYVTVPAK